MSLTKPPTSPRSTEATMCPACDYVSWATGKDAIEDIWVHVHTEHPASARRLTAAARDELGHERHLTRSRLARGPTKTKRSVGKIPTLR